MAPIVMEQAAAEIQSLGDRLNRALEQLLEFVALHQLKEELDEKILS
jgi:hypothetical protein